MKSGVRRLGLVVALALALVVTGLLTARWVLSWQPVDGQGRADVVTAERLGSQGDADEQDAGVAYPGPGEGYQLKQVVVLARHSIRAPLSSTGSALALATPHEWIPWTADASGLTLRGGVLETMLGQYMRTWLEEEGLIEREWQPEEGAIRVYANSLQRTHATAQYFISGMLPTAGVPVETHFALDELDPTFIPYLTYMSDAYNEAALEQIAQMGGTDGIAGLAGGLDDSFELLEQVCDYRESEGYQSGELKDFDTTDTEVVLEQGKEPALSGSLKTATSLADALVLQYYEADDEHAAFGKELSLEQWEQIAEIKDRYCDVLFTAPLVATNVAHPLLDLIGSELDTEERAFTFLCGHDSDIASVLAALGAGDYRLPNAIEKRTPIGSMVLFEKWEDQEGNLFGRVRLVYQSLDQLRSLTMLMGSEHPESYELDLEGLEKNDEGLYAYKALRERLQSATDAYHGLEETYGDEDGLDAAA